MKETEVKDELYGKTGKGLPHPRKEKETLLWRRQPSELSISHETKLRTGLESNRAKQLVSKLRITASYKPVKRSLNSYLSHLPTWLVFLFGWFLVFIFYFPVQVCLEKFQSCQGCYGEGSAHSRGSRDAAANVATLPPVGTSHKRGFGGGKGSCGQRTTIVEKFPSRTGSFTSCESHLMGFSPSATRKIIHPKHQS